MTPTTEIHFAYFISAHGFGHASRAAAVMAALAERIPCIHFDLFTEAPEWFFTDALQSIPFSIHPVKTDIGLIQKSPMVHDLNATLQELDRFIPFDETVIQRNAALIREQKCVCVLCDIAPLGIAAAEKAGVPSVLIENFTWDWIYEEYTATHPGFADHNRYLKEIFSDAQYHIQTVPYCSKYPGADLTAYPVSRKPRLDRNETRKRLGIQPGDAMVLITMGGIPENFKNLSRLRNHGRFNFVVPGGHSHYEWNDHLILIPHHSRFYHPDLIRAADIVIAKAGYSTISEVYQAGKPFGFISRSNFREAAPLADYIRHEMNGIEIPEEDYRQNRWTNILPELEKIPAITRDNPNGADQIAEFVISKFDL